MKNECRNLVFLLFLSNKDDLSVKKSRIARIFHWFFMLHFDFALDKYGDFK